jgi:hypothetical protein
MRNRGYIENLKRWQNSVGLYSMEYSDSNKLFFYKRFAHNLTIFLIGKIWLNIGICPTLGFSILKISPLEQQYCIVEITGILENFPMKKVNLCYNSACIIVPNKTIRIK